MNGWGEKGEVVVEREVLGGEGGLKVPFVCWVKRGRRMSVWGFIYIFRDWIFVRGSVSLLF